MNRKDWNLPRRTFLRASGVSLALPVLEAMLPVRRTVSAQDRAAAAGAGLGTDGASPVRFAVFRQAQGTVAEHWLPEAGPIRKLPSLLAPYESVRDKLTLVSNLTSSGIIGGRHYRSGHDLSMSLFTAASNIDKKTGKASISIDQYLALHLGKDTPITSLGLSQRSRSSDLFWTNETTKLPLEGNPYLVFNRIFKPGGSRQNSTNGHDSDRSFEQTPMAADRSILDVVMDQSKSLKRNLGVKDQRHLDQFMDSIREVERRMAIYEDRKHHAMAEQRGISILKLSELDRRQKTIVSIAMTPSRRTSMFGSCAIFWCSHSRRTALAWAPWTSTSGISPTL